jgi:hypothetical protein
MSQPRWSLATLLIFKHLVYDYVLRILPLALVLKRSSRIGKDFTFVTVFLFWYGWRMVGLETQTKQPTPIHIVNVLLLGATLVAWTCGQSRGGTNRWLGLKPRWMTSVEKHVIKRWNFQRTSRVTLDNQSPSQRAASAFAVAMSTDLLSTATMVCTIPVILLHALKGEMR